MKIGFFAFLTISLVFIGGVFAQSSGVTGTIFDAQGAVIPGMEMSVADSRGKTVVARSNDEGRFAVELPVGTYSLEIGGGKYSLFCKVVIESYRVVNPREPMNLDVLLAEGRSSHGGHRCRTKVIRF